MQKQINVFYIYIYLCVCIYIYLLFKKFIIIYLFLKLRCNYLLQMERVCKMHNQNFCYINKILENIRNNFSNIKKTGLKKCGGKTQSIHEKCVKTKSQWCDLVFLIFKRDANRSVFTFPAAAVCHFPECSQPSHRVCGEA